MAHVVGVDAGGTSTRAVAVADDGTVLGRGRSGAGNPNSVPPAEAAAHAAEAIGRALDGLDPAATRACVQGMAGASKLTDPEVAALFERAWAGLRMGCPVRVVGDAEAAFASATSAPDGTVVVAGTGSIAGRIRKRRMVATIGGYGWLLGDEGSAFWLGREAVRAALDVLGRGAPVTGLPAAVLAEALAVTDPTELTELTDSARHDLFRRLITVVNAEPPIRLARFAPLVSAAEAAGDPAADRIVERAAELLAGNALAAREPGEDTPVVLVGSVLGDASPVGVRVRAKLAGLDVRASVDGVLGAAFLAAVDAFGENTPHPTATG
ncbi:BadF-type ATPase [Amycolatopsis arida]|uniref:BadF-type ATPase n=1 Tax=Amycolatopsis arida TaxID=587909 RepID=A0A1I5QUP6_9PSEU|nr:BadF/BadG/BcrA/BcrD ATPase family protein [Amycolatopsis arida]TDX98964.1 N-acetylglucosamine kinase-like BadF-type ATPase [Amycolatopsis arida]SFP49807.1 BadF-type ATPase [Amycolatopsis arida]